MSASIKDSASMNGGVFLMRLVGARGNGKAKNTSGKHKPKRVFLLSREESKLKKGCGTNRRSGNEKKGGPCADTIPLLTPKPA